MPVETERKFLVNRDKLFKEYGFDYSWPHENLRQYYIVATKEVTIRMRLHSDKSVLCIKHGGSGISVNELEFEFSPEEYYARKDGMIGEELVKRRYSFYFGDKKWELDVFLNMDLMLLELEHPKAAEVTFLPSFIDREVSEDSNYKNAVLALKGFNN